MCVHMCVCVCVCERKREGEENGENERERDGKAIVPSALIGFITSRNYFKVPES